MKIALIMHPRPESGRVEEFQEHVAKLRAAGHEVRPRLTFEGGDAARYAAAAVRAGCDVVVAAGGDGTVNEVVNGLGRGGGGGGGGGGGAGAGRRRRRPRLAVVPTGTANDFAAGLGLPEDAGEALRVAVEGRAMAVDVARVNRRRFINASTGGFGAEATESTSSETKRLLGAWAYVITGVKKFVELRGVEARFTADGKLLHEGSFMLFAVGNGRQTGGGSLLTPRAEVDDGWLDVLVVPELPRVDFLALLPDLRSGTHLQSPDVIYGQARELRVDAKEDLSVNADGEPLRGRRFRYGVEPEPLEVMVP